MKITTVGRKPVVVTPDLKELFEKKLKKFDRYFRDDASAGVTLSEGKKGRKTVELTISSAGTIFRAESTEETFRNAFDRTMSMIERQMRRNKTRLERRLRQDAFVPAEAEIGDDYPEEEEFDIRVKNFTLEPMTPEEAVLRMNLIGHEFFMFLNDESGKVCTVYKRKNGGYGLIEPE